MGNGRQSRKRPRYIVVLYDLPVREIRRAVEHARWSLGPPKLIEAYGGVGVVRTWHLDTQEMIRRINGIRGLRTLKTSGTLRRAREIARRKRA